MFATWKWFPLAGDKHVSQLMFYYSASPLGMVPLLFLYSVVHDDVYNPERTDDSTVYLTSRAAEQRGVRDLSHGEKTPKSRRGNVQLKGRSAVFPLKILIL